AAEAVAYSKGKLSLNPELYKKKDNTSNERKNDS
ncbi:cell division protein, partial [Escherichia coli]|nr:cell division protein [Escherichia coli]